VDPSGARRASHTELYCNRLGNELDGQLERKEGTEQHLPHAHQPTPTLSSDNSLTRAKCYVGGHTDDQSSQEISGNESNVHDLNLAIFNVDDIDALPPITIMTTMVTRSATMRPRSRMNIGECGYAGFGGGNPVKSPQATKNRPEAPLYTQTSS